MPVDLPQSEKDPFSTGTVVNVPGGRFRAVREEDGTYTIFDVPIMSVVPKGALGNEEEIGRTWFQATIDRHAQMEGEEQHLAPVHANHHGDGGETPRLGFLRLRRVGTVTQRGKEMPALFADISKISPYDFESIVLLRYPYRSVEISSWGKNEIASLALLTDEAPHFKLPMLTVAPLSSPGAIAASTRGFFLVTNFEDSAMRNKDRRAAILAKVAAIECPKAMDAFAGLEKLSDARKKLVLASVGKHVAFFNEGFITPARDVIKTRLEDEKKDDKEDDKNLDETDGMAAKIAKVIKDFQDKLPDMVRSILEGMMPSLPDEPASNAPAEPLKEQGVKPKTEESEVAKLTARIAILEDRETKRNAESTIGSLVESTVAGLSAKGIKLSETSRAKLKELAENSTDAAKACKIFAETYEMDGRKDPPQKFSDWVGSHPNEEDPKEVAKFSTRGPEVLAAARELCGEYHRLKDAGFGLTASLEQYIEANLGVDRKSVLASALNGGR